MLTIPFTDVAGVGFNSTAGALNVFITGGASSGAVTDESAFTAGTSLSTSIGGVFNDTPVAALTSGQQGAARVTANRALHVNVRSQAGVEQGTVAAPFNTQDLSDGPVTPGAAASKSMLNGLVANSTAPTATAGQQLALQGDLNGNLKVVLVNSTDASPIPVTNANDNAGTAVLTSVAASITSVSLLASNTARKSFSLYNDSSSVLYVAYAATASNSAYTVKVQPQAFHVPDKNYTGAISGIWVTAAGAAKMTELSA